MKYYIPLALSALMIGSVTLGATENKISHADKQVKNMSVAQFKGNCIRMKGTLSYENKQWTCNGKDTEKGLKSIPVKLPQ